MNISRADQKVICLLSPNKYSFHILLDMEVQQLNSQIQI